MNRRKFNKEFKRQVVAELDAGKPVSQVAREYEVSPTQVYSWQKRFAEYGEAAFAGKGQAYTQEAKIAELERKIGQLTMENELLKKHTSAYKRVSAKRKAEVDGDVSINRAGATGWKQAIGVADV